LAPTQGQPEQLGQLAQVVQPDLQVMLVIQVAEAAQVQPGLLVPQVQAAQPVLQADLVTLVVPALWVPQVFRAQ
jgi:hypothetical protein